MLGELNKAFRRSDAVVCGFGNQVSDAVGYRAAGIHPNYIFIIKDSTLYMLSGKYKFTMESLYQNVETLFPQVNRNSTRNTKKSE